MNRLEYTVKSRDFSYTINRLKRKNILNDKSITFIQDYMFNIILYSLIVDLKIHRDVINLIYEDNSNKSIVYLKKVISNYTDDKVEPMTISDTINMLETMILIHKPEPTMVRLVILEYMRLVVRIENISLCRSLKRIADKYFRDGHVISIHEPLDYIKVRDFIRSNNG